MLTSLINRYKERNLIERWFMNAFVIFTLGFLIDYSILNATPWVDKKFTEITAQVSQWLISVTTNADVGMYVERIGIQICTKGNHCIYIGDACNGRNLYLVYVGLLVSIPYGDWKNKTIFSLIGIGLIFLANILRIIFLVALIDVSFDLFSVFHHYIFQLLLYLLMFGLWNQYLKKYKK